MTPDELMAENAQLISQVGIPRPFEADAFVQRVSAFRGRPMVIQKLPELPVKAPCGMWLDLNGTDVIFVDHRTSPLHRLHVTLHEIGHALRSKPESMQLDPALCEMLFPGLPVQFVLNVLGRTTYDSEEELAAELFAAQVLEAAASTVGLAESKALQRLERTMTAPTEG